MPRVIRLGDATSHGGKVVQVAETSFQVEGIPVARVGDICSCPQQGHTNCVILEGDEGFQIDGVPVAFEGHKTSCGATLLASTDSFGKD